MLRPKNLDFSCRCKVHVIANVSCVSHLMCQAFLVIARSLLLGLLLFQPLLCMLGDYMLNCFFCSVSFGRSICLIFSEELERFIITVWMVSVVFGHILALVLTKCSIWPIYIKIVNDGVLGVTFTDTGGALNCWVRRFLAKF